MAVPKTRAGGTMTESAYRSFIKSGLRQKSRRWAPLYQALDDAYVGKKTNKATGRLAKHFECKHCKEHFPAKNVAVDHIHPVVRLSGFVSWDDVVDRLFVEKHLLQVLCTECHHCKTQAERKLARDMKKDEKLLLNFTDMTKDEQEAAINEVAEIIKQERAS
ncbi:putative HNHc domain containing protein [Vibrio phage 275E43-1]|nr:putative HNHc domain containing protein [Vibrio phage 275E43-1]